MSANVLLLLSATTVRRPALIRSNLAAAIQNKTVLNGTLYVQIWRAGTTESSSDQQATGSSIQVLSQACSTIYAFANLKCPNTDVRFVVRNTCQKQVFQPKKPVGFVCGDVNLQEFHNDIQAYVSKCSQVPIQFLASAASEEEALVTEESGNSKKFDVVALGGTFDRIHNGHKILLTEAVMRCNRELIVGVTNEDMTKSKLLHEMIEPCEARMKSVKEFLEDISPPLVFRVVPIADPFGPTINEKDIDLIVVSKETIRGANKINEIRKSKGFPPLEVHSIDLVADSRKESDLEEGKISSSSKRLRALGTRLRPPLKEPSLPYIIGLTGGSASGKSTICDYLSSLSIATINCDQLGHQAYTPGTECYNRIVQTFGEDILNEEKSQINRKVLGSKVFGNAGELKKLTDIVWPEIRRLALDKIKESIHQGHKIIVLDAAVLLEAGWDDLCHEVWVVFVPKDEAITRIQERDNVSKEAAESRINSQLSNEQRLLKATFAFCSLWEKEYTQAQVNKGLSDVQSVVTQLC